MCGEVLGGDESWATDAESKKGAWIPTALDATRWSFE